MQTVKNGIKRVRQTLKEYGVIILLVLLVILLLIDFTYFALALVFLYIFSLRMMVVDFHIQTYEQSISRRKKKKDLPRRHARVKTSPLQVMAFTLGIVGLLLMGHPGAQALVFGLLAVVWLVRLLPWLAEIFP